MEDHHHPQLLSWQVELGICEVAMLKGAPQRVSEP